MRSQIDISPDGSQPEGGYAIILLKSLTETPDDLKFVISAIPDDPDDPQSDMEWSLGENLPLRAETTAEGLALTIGPDVVDRPELQPGTPVTFRLASANIYAELSWPDLPVTIPGKLPAPVIDPSDLRAHKIETTRRNAEAEIEAKAREINAEIDAEIAAAIAIEAAAIAKSTSPQQNIAVPNAASSKPAPILKLAQVSSAVTAAKTPSQSPAQTPFRSDIKLSADALPKQDTSAPERQSAPPAANQHEAALAKIAEYTATPAAVSSLPATSRAGAPLSIPAAHEIATAPETHSTSNRRYWLAIALAVLALPVLLFALWPRLTSNSLGPQSALQQLASSDWVTSLIAVGNRSPNGVDASNISAQEALRRAEQAIFGKGTKGSLEERKFWLRKSITLMLSAPQSRWAFTQLGALKTASPDGRKMPDYSSSKTLWEIASASGDVVATCFLAQLYELGLGVAPSSERAKTWQQRAEANGGCNLKRQRTTSTLTN